MRSAFSIFLTFLLLTTQIGISFATHYCGGEVFKNSISLIGGEAATCNMQEPSEKDCINQSGIFNSSCCNDHAVTIQLKDQYNSSPSLALDNSLIFLASFTVSYIYLTQETDPVLFNPDYYDPPVLELDIPVLIQSFLI